MKQSLILKHFPNIKKIEIFDTHHLVSLKFIDCNNPLVFPIIDEAVRDGRIAFDYLLSDAVSSINDIEIKGLAPDHEKFLQSMGNILGPIDEFNVGDSVIFNDQEFIITRFHFSSKSVTAEIIRKDIKLIIPLHSLTKAPEELIEHIDGHKIEHSTHSPSSAHKTHVENPTALCYARPREEIMDTHNLMKVKNDAEIKANKIGKLLNDKANLEQSIEDLKYLQKHAGEMIFTGNSGRIGEREVMLKTVKINTLAGCVAVPKLLIELAETKLKELEIEATSLTA